MAPTNMGKPKRKSETNLEKVNKLSKTIDSKNGNSTAIGQNAKQVEEKIKCMSKKYDKAGESTPSSSSILESTQMPGTNSWQSQPRNLSMDSLDSRCSQVLLDGVQGKQKPINLTYSSNNGNSKAIASNREDGNTDNLIKKNGDTGNNRAELGETQQKIRWAQVNLENSASSTGMMGKIVYMSCLTEALTELSPKMIADGIHKICGPVEKVQSLASGKLMITTNTKEQVESLLKAELFLNKYRIKVNMAWNRQIKCGKIYSSSLTGMMMEEILESLRSQGVVGVRKLYHNPRHPCHWYVLAFLRDVPETVNMEYLRLKVHEYYPSPMLCTKCYLYGHTASKCRNMARCMKCTERGHKVAECPKQSEELKCSNCLQNHSSMSRKCPYYLKEMEVCKLKAQANITFKEAREELAKKSASQLGRKKQEVEGNQHQEQYSSLESLIPVVVEEPEPSLLNFTLPDLNNIEQSNRSYAEALVQNKKASNQIYNSNRNSQVNSVASREGIKHEIKACMDSCISNALVRLLPVVMRLLLSSSVAEKAECFGEIGEIFGVESTVNENLHKIGLPSMTCP